MFQAAWSSSSSSSSFRVLPEKERLDPERPPTVHLIVDMHMDVYTPRDTKISSFFFSFWFI